MRLLIITQAVDRSDPVLGFFHRWLLEFAKHIEAIEVICLRAGEFELPATVRVHSLGKEQQKGRAHYLSRFFQLVTSLSYDAVLVHMNPEYVLLGGPLWKLSQKPIYLWYNHPAGGLRLSLAMLLADTVFHTSPYAASAHSKKSRRMPAGIDTELFAPQNVERKTYALYLQGRVSPSKNIDKALAALRLLRDRGVDATLTIVGPGTPRYLDNLRTEFADLFKAHAVSFLGPKPNHETPILFSSHAVSLNLAASGHYDKTVLESMACGTPVITAGKAFTNLIPGTWSGADTPQKLAEALQQFLRLSAPEREALGAEEREAVVRHEGLAQLARELKTAILAV